MPDGKRRKVARQLKYRSAGMPQGRDDLSDLAELFDREWGDDGDDGGVGVREPRRPLPPTPVSGGSARALPESIITAELPNPPVR